LAWCLQAKRKPKGLLAKLLEDNPIGRNIVFRQVDKASILFMDSLPSCFWE
jgi:hypothetical protein